MYHDYEAAQLIKSLDKKNRCRLRACLKNKSCTKGADMRN